MQITSIETSFYLAILLFSLALTIGSIFIMITRSMSKNDAQFQEWDDTVPSFEDTRK